MTGIIQQISMLSVLVPFVTGLIRWRQLAGVQLSAWLLSAAALTPQLIAFVGPRREIVWLLYNFYTAVEFPLMLNMLSRLTGKKQPWLYASLVSGFIVIGLLLSVREPLNSRLFYELVVYDNLVYTTLILLMIYRQMDEADFVVLSRETIWFVIGVLVYAPVTVYSFSLWKQMHGPVATPVVFTARIVSDLANTLLYLCFAVGIVTSKNVSGTQRKNI